MCFFIFALSTFNVNKHAYASYFSFNCIYKVLLKKIKYKKSFHFNFIFCEFLYKIFFIQNNNSNSKCKYILITIYFTHVNFKFY